jgi:hypothetical protein
MRSILSLPAVAVFASLAGCVYDYSPPPDHVTTYSYVAPSDYYPPPPPEGTVVVYDNSDDYGWPPNGRYRNW